MPASIFPSLMHIAAAKQRSGIHCYLFGPAHWEAKGRLSLIGLMAFVKVLIKALTTSYGLRKDGTPVCYVHQNGLPF
jgi:hypothetical protein